MRHEKIEMRSAEPIETRDEDDESGIEEATKAVEELRTSITDHQKRSDEKLDKGFKDIGDRVTALEAKANRPAGTGTEQRDENAELERRAFDKLLRYGKDALEPEEMRALSVTGGSGEGTSTVPETFIREIVKNLTEISPMRELARITNVGGTPVLLPRRTGKPTGSWEGETSEADETSSTYGQWSIDVFEARVFTDISNRLLEDSAFDMESEIRMDLAEAFSELEATAFLTGDGEDAPNGLITDSDFVTADASSVEVNADELIDLFYSLKGRYRRNGSWAMNASTIAAVRKLKDDQGRYLWNDSLAEGQPPTILGRPVVEFPDLADVEADAVPIVFGDFDRGYRIVQRVDMQVLPDRYTQARNSLVRFHARMRVGGKLVLPEALKGLTMPGS